jgi:hypothetical protein
MCVVLAVCSALHVETEHPGSDPRLLPHDLQLRGLAFGIISSPYIITVSIDCLDFPVAIRQLTAVFVRSTVQPWFTAEIADHFISTGNWRWGYGVSTDCLSTAQRPQS